MFLDMKYYVDREPEILMDVFNNFDNNSKKLSECDLSFESIIIYATGSSANAAYAAKAFMSKILKINIEIKEPSMALNYDLYTNPKTLYIAISQGGHSSSTLNLINKLQKNNIIYAITSDLDSPIGKESKLVLNLGMKEDMPFVTAGQSSTTVFLWKIALNLSLRKKIITESEFEYYNSEIQKMISEIPNFINKVNLWFNKEKERLYNGNRFLCIGYGSCYGTAREFETKFTETVRVPSAGFELEEFMHGPYIGINKNDIVFMLDNNGKLTERTRKLASFLNDHINLVYLFTGKELDGFEGIDFEIDINEDLSCILYNTIPHLVSWYISQYKKIDLTKSSYPDFDVKMKSKI